MSYIHIIQINVHLATDQKTIKTVNNYPILKFEKVCLIKSTKCPDVCKTRKWQETEKRNEKSFYLRKNLNGQSFKWKMKKYILKTYHLNLVLCLFCSA